MAIDTIGTNAIANDAVNAAKIAAGAVDADITAIPDGSVSTAKLADNAVTGAKLYAENLGRRNILINGAFQHWQRGTSFSANGYGSDRWKLYAPGGHAYSRSTDTPDSPNNFEFSASVGGSGDATGLTQFVESRNAKHIPSSGTTKVILSFYLKHTTNSGTAKITSVVGTMDSADNSGASTNRSTKNHDTTTSWARYTHEMTGADLTAAVTNGLTVNIKHNGSGTTAFLLTGCQLEINETVTDFERRDVGEEQQRCFRYYYDSKKANGDNASYYYAPLHRYDSHVKGVTWEFATAQHPVKMRTTPTITLIDGNNNTGKITHWTTGGGNQTHNHNAYTTHSKEMNVSISDYSTSNIYGFYANYIADAEI